MNLGQFRMRATAKAEAIPGATNTVIVTEEHAVVEGVTTDGVVGIRADVGREKFELTIEFRGDAQRDFACHQVLRSIDEFAEAQRMRGRLAQLLIALLLPSFDDADQAIDWCEARGEIVRIFLTPGDDGKVRGTALVRRRWRGRK